MLGSATVSDLCSVFGIVQAVLICTFEDLRDGRVGTDMKSNSCYESLKYDGLRHIIRI